jgi:hypothetical protein
MRPISFKRHRFPPDVIRQAVWLYFRFTLSLRDVEELLAARGVDVTYETVRCCDRPPLSGPISILGMATKERLAVRAMSARMT